MAYFISGVQRLWQSFNPPVVEKDDDALKFGILGAATIAPLAFITPAKSHPKVIVYTIAARDKARAAAFAKKHGIPHVADNYEAILEDPDVDAVYIPLPCGLHFEWALRALARGKHVLLEKPSTANSLEARMLFRSKLLHAQPTAPVLMEAFHNRFTPAWTCFLRELDRHTIAHVSVRGYVPWFFLPRGDIRFDYRLAGGAMLDLGTYFVAAMRDVLGDEPEGCEACDVHPREPPEQLCDDKFSARLTFPGGAVGDMDGALGTGFWEWLRSPTPTVTVTHRPVTLPPDQGQQDEDQDLETERVRTVTFTNFLIPTLYHSVTVQDDFTVRRKDTREPVTTFTEKETNQAYTFRDMGIDQPGEEHWQSYRYMLEQFVNRVRGEAAEPGRAGAAIGDFKVTSEDAVNQMRVLDLLYTKSGLGSRLTSEFRLP